MYIECRNQTGTDRSMFIIDFFSEKDLSNLVDLLDRVADLCGNSPKTHNLRGSINKIRERCSDRYAKGDIAISSVMFDDEMARLTMSLIGALQHIDRTMLKDPDQKTAKLEDPVKT